MKYTFIKISDGSFSASLIRDDDTDFRSELVASSHKKARKAFRRLRVLISAVG